MNYRAIKEFEQAEISKLVENKRIDDFKAGDTVKVGYRIIDGNNERIQNYEGVVIAKSNCGISSNFTVRKISYNEGVERQFMTYSPLVAYVEVVKRGVVRRAKLYYLRERSGKAARIKEKTSYTKR